MNWWKNIFTSSQDYPEFWKDYSSQFNKPNQGRCVILDCETTGLNPKEDKILSIGAIAMHGSSIRIADSFSVFVEQQLHRPETVAIHGIINNNANQLISEKEAIMQLLNYLGNAKIIGHHIQFDISIITTALQNLNLPKLKNKVLDTSQLYEKYKGVSTPMHKSLDELCEEFKIPKKERHTALGDAYLTALVYQRLITH